MRREKKNGLKPLTSIPLCSHYTPPNSDCDIAGSDGHEKAIKCLSSMRSHVRIRRKQLRVCLIVKFWASELLKVGVSWPGYPIITGKLKDFQIVTLRLELATTQNLGLKGDNVVVLLKKMG